MRKYFPDASIVADRFRVIRLITHHFLALCRELDPAASKYRGPISLMRRHCLNLKPEQLAVSIESSPPRLVGWLLAGSRADSGLCRIQVSNRRLTFDLFDPQRRVAVCCSKGFVRTSYDYKDVHFVQRGPPAFGDVGVTGPNGANPL